MMPLAKNGYSEKEVLAALKFGSGARQIAFRYDLLDKNDVKIGEAKNAGGSVRVNSLASIKRTASFELEKPDLNQIDYLNDRIKPIFIVKMPDGGSLEYSLGVFLISSPKRTAGGALIKRSIEAYDKSLIIQQDMITKNHVIAKGRNYVNAVKEMLEGAGITKIDIPDFDANCRVDIEYEVGKSKLAIINDFLNLINYNSLTITEDGVAMAKPYRSPTERNVDHSYTDDNLSILLSDAEEELDIFDTPNIFIRVASSPETHEVFQQTFINDDPSSALSTVRRGRNIVDYGEISDISSDDLLREYVSRIAREKSQAYSKIRFQTAIMPNHGALDMIYLKHRNLKTEGKFAETNWSLELRAGGMMSHEARRLVNI